MSGSGDRAVGDVDAVVLAAGFGKRLRPLTDATPKALVPLFGVPLLDHVLARLARAAARPRRVAINLHHLPEPIVRHVGDGARHGLAVVWSHESGEILGTGGALRRLEPSLADRFLVVNGDVWLEAPLDTLAAGLARPASDAVAAVGLVRVPERPELHLVALDPADERVVAIGDRPSPAPAGAPRWIFAGAHVATRSLLDVLPDEGFACVVRDGYVRQLAAGQRLQGVPFPGAAWHDVGTPASYLQAHLALFPRLDAIARGLPGWRCPDLGGRRFVSPDARIAPGATLVPPVVIHAGARVEDGATVGPATVLGARAVVTGPIRVARSVVWEQAEIREELDAAIATVRDLILTTPPSDR